LAKMMLDLAMEFPEYKETAHKVKTLEVTAADYYGKGYQDVQNRVPKIDNTMKDLGWKPQVVMADALKHIYEAYRGQVAEARKLVD
ncbi:MAG: bifunctional UDP-4-keto-pentose/UDP-xylose synthase, partial [Coriobacteriia bacterium]